MAVPFSGFVAEAQANKQAAATLGISIKTVEKHRQHLMDKLNIHDTAGLTRYAIAAGVIESKVQLTIVEVWWQESSDTCAATGTRWLTGRRRWAAA